jgi:hypothetical protein
MILALLLAATGLNIIEIPNANAPFVTVQASIQTGSLQAKDRALAQLVDDTILDATADYNHYKLGQFSTLAGESMRCSMSPDHFRIQLEVPKDQLQLGGDIMNDVLRHARFDLDTLTTELDHVTSRQRDYWSETIQPWNLSFTRISQKDVIDFYGRVFRPENVTIAISGPFAVGEGEAALNHYMADWTLPKPKLYRDYSDVPKTLAQHSFPITTLDIHGSQYTAGDDMFPQQLLAATALGVGKWSSMHRILREKLAMSYRQEAVVLPTPLGFETHLVVVLDPLSSTSSEPIKKALLDDVATWDDSIRDRAIGMAQSYLLQEAPVNPLYFDGTRPITGSLEDQTFLQAYWQQKANTTWNAMRLLIMMKKVSLADLKKTASDLLTGSQTVTIPAKQ